MVVGVRGVAQAEGQMLPGPAYVDLMARKPTREMVRDIAPPTMAEAAKDNLIQSSRRT